MPLTNFSTPHCHIQSLDSGSTPKDFIEREKQLGTGAITVTDHGSLGIARKVYDLARENGLTPILGLEGYFRDDNCPILRAHEVPQGEDKEGNKHYRDYWNYGHLTLHFLDQAAYDAGIRVLSRAALNRDEKYGIEYKPIFDWHDVEELASYNVVFGSSCLAGVIQKHLSEEKGHVPRPDIAVAYLERFRHLAKPGNFYWEVFPHRCTHYWRDFVEVEYDDGTKEQFRIWNTVFTNVDKIRVEDLAEVFKHKNNPHKEIRAVMKNRKEVPLPAPKTLKSVIKHEGYVANDCTVWSPDGDVQLATNKWVLEQAAKYGDKVLISDDAHYAHPEENVVQNVRQSQMRWGPFYGLYHRHSSDEAFAYFNQFMGISQSTFEGWIQNNQEWAARFKGFKLETKRSLPVSFFPQDTLGHLIKLVKQHGRMRWGQPEYMQRLQQEIELFYQNGTVDLLPYFFVDEKVCDAHARLGIPTGPGRGSAAGTLLSYVLGITHVDPLKYKLSLDRFITLDRIQSGSWPDIDQDLADRDVLLDPQHGLLKKWFGENYAQVSVDTALRVKRAIKDVARALHGRVPDEIEELTKKLPTPPQGVDDHKFIFGYSDGVDYVPGLLETSPELKAYTEKWPKDWAIVEKCLGLAAGKGRHACAYVIADRPIREFIPLQKVSDMVVTQYTAESVEAAGGLKMDFLGLNSLKDIGNCIQLIQQRYQGDFKFPAPPEIKIGADGFFEIPEEAPSMTIDGEKVPLIYVVPFKDKFYNVWDLPEDQAVFRDICEGKTETVFQFGTPGAQQWLRHFNNVKKVQDGVVFKALSSIEDLAAFTALDRPGGLDVYVDTPGAEEGQKHNMLVEFARRSRGETPAKMLEVFNELFPETYGIMVYQEQLQYAYQVLTGCTGPEAEEFRRNVAKKKKDKIIKAYPFFMERASKRLGEKVAQETWDFFLAWARYGFNKSHAVCYVVIGYACAFLKHYYPLEWWTAVLRNAKKNEIDQKFWIYCGGLVDVPDINKSGENFEIQGTRIRAPLFLMHGVGEKAHDELCEGRPYKDIDDFCQRVQDRKVRTGSKVEAIDKKTGQKVEKFRLGRSSLHSGVVATLIMSGSMDSLFPPEFSDLDKIAAYEAALGRVKGKKKPEMIKRRNEFISLDYLMRFQLRKQILPSFAENLLPKLVETKVEGIRETIINSRKLGQLKRHAFDHRKREYYFVDGKTLEHFNSLKIPPNDTLRAACAAYVVDERRFNYQGSKLGIELMIEVDGTRIKVNKWPSHKTGKHENLAPVYKGCVCIVLVSRYKEGKDMSIDHIQVVRGPLDSEAEESSSPENKNE
jgi:DNA polymerase III alpha subunit